MKDWKIKAQILLEEMDSLSDGLRARIRKFTRFNQSLMIIPYLGFGTPERLILKGRVLENQGFTVKKEDSAWQNLVNMYRRFETDEISNARLKASFLEIEKEIFTDREGYFDVEISLDENLESRLWQNVELELLSPLSSPKERISAVAPVL